MTLTSGESAVQSKRHRDTGTQKLIRPVNNASPAVMRQKVGSKPPVFTAGLRLTGLSRCGTFNGHVAAPQSSPAPPLPPPSQARPINSSSAAPSNRCGSLSGKTRRRAQCRKASTLRQKREITGAEKRWISCCFSGAVQKERDKLTFL